ncbi:hypothetical protein BCR32DRAFT_299589 [Anaeromyces robustus]|uniref:Uncharacterized protein n=1 Tax=Anaeromyces robustus TaxID=1754192 RepID=A0A1Y1X668_9FUNG|nr:hypothetical protein BCR32DRAFT_299589 [Anaeromyces robustus]|eukprot:ORX81165.1 hypothetical protein BCR32DRAFT_299589 [Anaeromyces robustus]
MKFYSVLAFFLLCTMLVLSNPIRSTEETENKLIEKRAKIPQSIIDYLNGFNGAVNTLNELGKAYAKKQEELQKAECINRAVNDLSICLKRTDFHEFCEKYQKALDDCKYNFNNK